MDPFQMFGFLYAAKLANEGALAEFVLHVYGLPNRPLCSIVSAEDFIAVAEGRFIRGPSRVTRLSKGEV